MFILRSSLTGTISRAQKECTGNRQGRDFLSAFLEKQSLRIYAGLWAAETQIGSGLQPGCGDPEDPWSCVEERTD